MKNFDWDNLVKRDIGVHCDTEEKANDFLKQAHEHGVTWVPTWYLKNENCSLLKKNEWSIWKSNTCYYVKKFKTTGLHMSLDDCRYHNDTIDWEIDTSKDLTEETKNTEETAKEQTKTVTGYTVFDSDWEIDEPYFSYEVNKILEKNIKLGQYCDGFCFFKKMVDCFHICSFTPETKVIEITILGDIVEIGDDHTDMYHTNKIQIIREVKWNEILELVNIGKGCTGKENTGNYNSGYFNSGKHNSGSRNSGNDNNGGWNTGNCNSGDGNSGHCNRGGGNSGGCNNGNYNSGDYNNGNYNSGDKNNGDYNSGDFNRTSFASGCFNTDITKMTFFDKPSNMTFEEWRSSEARLILNRVKNITTEWWNELTKKEKRVIKKIPNFDAEKFSQITGIDVEAIGN